MDMFTVVKISKTLIAMGDATLTAWRNPKCCWISTCHSKPNKTNQMSVNQIPSDKLSVVLRHIEKMFTRLWL